MQTYSFDRAHTAEIEKKVSPMIRLLDDTDETVLLAVRKALLQEGASAIPFLRTALSITNNKYHKSNIEKSIRDIRLEPLILIKEFLQQDNIDDSFQTLEKYVVYLSRFGFPETDEEYISSFLDKIALEVHHEYINKPQQNYLTLLMALNNMFFEKYGFRGTTDHYFNPEQSYFYSLLRNKIGIPISLSVLYMLIADRCGISIYGVSMPLHFLTFSTECDTYIDVFNNGIMIGKEDCIEFLKKSKIGFREEMLAEASVRTILLRMIRNLVIAHRKYGQEWESQQLELLLDKEG